MSVTSRSEGACRNRNGVRVKKSASGFWVAIVAACWIQHLRAELPPSAYPDPAFASEQIDIRVLSVSKRKTEDSTILTRWDVEIRAEVRAVRKTATGLKEGARVVLRYSAHNYKQPGWTGPGSPPILQAGVTYSAALNAVGEDNPRGYSPFGAAYNSFRPVLPKKR